MARKKYHVTYDQESGQWKGKAQGGERASVVETPRQMFNKRQSILQKAKERVR